MIPAASQSQAQGTSLLASRQLDNAIHTPPFPPAASKGVTTAPPADMQQQQQPFGSDDGMMLQLIYQQQLAIQGQLNTMVVWMQQISTRVAHVEHYLSSAADKGGRTSSGVMTAAAPAASATKADANTSGFIAHHETEDRYQQPQAEHAPSAQQMPVSSPPQSSRASALQQSLTTLNAQNTSITLEGSRSCTPPGENISSLQHSRQSNAIDTSNVNNSTVYGSSATGKLVNLSMDSVAPPWNPQNLTTTVSERNSSMQSSRGGSQLGRQDNPLLSSLRSAGKAPTSAVGTRLPSSQGRGATAASLSANMSSNSQPYIAPARGAATERDIPQYRRVVPVDSSTTLARPSSHSSALTAAAAGGRPTTTGAPKDSHKYHQRGPDEEQRRSQQIGPADSGRAASAHGSPGVSASGRGGGGSSDNSRSPKRHQGGGMRGFPSGPDQGSADYDSLSDGYGSYESRQYMKSVGLM